LVNLRGELVGINAAIVGTGAGNAGIGFAIPVNMVRAIADQLVKYGMVERGELGFAVGARTPDLARKYKLPAGQAGAVVTRVDANSAADRAGIKLGDLVTSLSGLPVKDARDLRNKLALLRVGDIADLTVLRKDSEIHLLATLTEPTIKVRSGEEISPLFEGATFTNALANAGEKGVEVSTVRAGSKAWNSGLREGDLITSVNRKRVMDADEFGSAIVKTPSSLVLAGTRDGKFLTLSIQTKDTQPMRP
jgi:serine protease Do/serine protease DegQ